MSFVQVALLVRKDERRGERKLGALLHHVSITVQGARRDPIYAVEFMPGACSSLAGGKNPFVEAMIDTLFFFLAIHLDYQTLRKLTTDRTFLSFARCALPFDNFSAMQAQQVIEHIVHWLNEYHRSSRTKGFVVGVSGGIDSAVVSTLCARTGHPVLVVEMPIRQSSSEVRRSHAHIEWLKSTFPNVSGGEVNLTDVFETFESTLGRNDLNETNSASELAFANTRSRMRMVSTAISCVDEGFSSRCSVDDLVLLRLAEELSRRRHG